MRPWWLREVEICYDMDMSGTDIISYIYEYHVMHLDRSGEAGFGRRQHPPKATSSLHTKLTHARRLTGTTPRSTLRAPTRDGAYGRARAFRITAIDSLDESIEALPERLEERAGGSGQTQEVRDPR